VSDAGPEATRDCGACGRPFAGKAGRMVDGKLICPTCGNRLRPKVACAGCGRPTARPRRGTPDGGLICEGCLNRDTHATCKVCRRHRPVAVRGDDGAPTCAGCAAAEPAVRACPDCGAAVPGRGAAPCHACSLKRLIARRLIAQADTVRPAWARSMYDAFRDWDGLPQDQYGVIRQAAAYAQFFAVVGAGCAGPGEVTQERLLELFGNDGLRRAMTVVRFLVAHLSLSWRRSERRRTWGGAGRCSRRPSRGSTWCRSRGCWR